MREVIVTVGTRAAGKSTFCKKALALDPSIVVVSRDDILIELFGKTSLDPYAGGHVYAYERMWEIAKKHLALDKVRMILDVWNEDGGARRNIIRKLRALGANRVVAWYFVTPIENVEEWFWKKPGIAKLDEMRSRRNEGLTFFLEDAPRRDHELFHKLASDIDSDGFDEVVRIDPTIMKPGHVLCLKNGSVSKPGELANSET